MKRTKTSMMVFCLVLLGIAENAQAECDARKDWFPHTRTCPPTFEAIKNPPCGFHQWAWHTFLWLTKPTGDGRIQLLDLPTGDDLFIPGRMPKKFSELQQRKSKELILNPRVRKTESVTHFADIRQAFSKGVLVDKNGHPVYYATHVNEDFYEFVRRNRLYTWDGYNKFPNDGTFPTRSLEVKSSWLVVEDDKAEGFFTTSALVNPLDCKGGNATCKGGDIIEDTTRWKKVRVALVGLHVVGVVEGHPEFVWATFEHVKNAPDLPPEMQLDSPKSVCDQNFTFYKAKTPAKECNIWNGQDVMLNVKEQTLSPVTQVFRRYAFGKADKENEEAIKSLNKSVHGFLREEGNPAEAKWLNYRLSGSVWFKPNQKLTPGDSGPAILLKTTGSIELSNATMETFTQGLPRFFYSKGCFACHDTGVPQGSCLPAKNINLSHILTNGVIRRHELETQKVVARLSTKCPAQLKSFKDVQDFLNDFVKTNGVQIPFGHKDFWNTMTYEDFTSGYVPHVTNPMDNKPIKILVRRNSAQSNLILALRGAKGTIFDPETGEIGRMPRGGPFMTDAQINLIADWIDRDCPNPKRP